MKYSFIELQLMQNAFVMPN